MPKLIDCPPEILTAIARLTGWSLSFRLTCKQVSRCFATPVYHFDTCLPIFYHECAQKFGQVVNGNTCGGVMFPSDLMTPLPESETRSFHFPVPVGDPYPTRIQLSLHDLGFDAIASLQLKLSHPEHFRYLHIFSLQYGKTSVSIMGDTMIWDVARSQNGGPIPLFPTMMPLLLGFAKDLPVRIEVQVWHPPEGFSFSVEVLPGKLIQPWTHPISVLYRRLGGITCYFSRWIAAWALRVPERGAPKIKHLRFMSREKRKKSPRTVCLNVKWLHHSKRHFPYPLDPEKYVLIPPPDPLYIAPQAITEILSVSYTFQDNPEESDWIELVDVKDCYFLSSLIFTFRNGKTDLMIQNGPQDSGYIVQ